MASRGAATEIPIGSYVQVSAGQGYVRWNGQNPAFAAGRFVGIELDEPGGKNDGSVKGEVYFTCKPNHGVFVRPSQVQVLRPPPAARGSSGITSRPLSRSSNLSSSTSTRPATLTTANRTLSARSFASQPSTRAPSPQKPLQTTQTLPTPSKRPSPSSPAPTRKLTSPASQIQRTSSTLGSTSASPSAGNLVSPPTTLSPQTQHQSIFAAPPDDRVPSPTRPGFPLKTQQTISRQPSPTRSLSPDKELLQRRRSSGNRSPIPPSSTSFPQGRDKEYEEMKIKMRVLEAKRAEDNEKLREMQGKVEEAAQFLTVRGKLQNKFSELQAELHNHRRTSKDLAAENSTLESRMVEMSEQLELSLLDKEFAEEKLEQLQADFDALKEEKADLEVEIEVMKEERLEDEAREGELAPEDSSIVGVDSPSRPKGSLVNVQLEKHNERLKDALIKLRDVSSETERQQRAKILELEHDLNGVSDLQSQYEMTVAKLENADAQIEDLKEQLDGALGAEDMLEQLTDRNLLMGEKIEEMRIIIEDLEALKELNDELEENHIEVEKQMLEELDMKEAQMRQQRKEFEELEETLLESEVTIGQFRELVLNLQSDMDVLREQQMAQISESQKMDNQSHAMMNLNLRLQSSAMNAKSKMIELELRKLEASQAIEHLRIVHAYLPQAYFEVDADATSCLLFFQRLAHKTSLINSILAQTHNLPESLTANFGSTSSLPLASLPDTLVGICELRGRLSHFSMVNKRYASYLLGCDVESFLKIGRVGLMMELGGIEKKMDLYIDLLKREEFREADCIEDLTRFLSQFEHLEETYFPATELDLADRELDMVLGFDFDLDNFAAAVGFAQHAIVSLIKEEGEEIEVDTGESTIEEAIYAPIQNILNQVKLAKAASKKLIRHVEELVRASTPLKANLITPLQALVADVSNAVDFAIKLAQRIGAYVNGIKLSKEPLELNAIIGFLQDITVESTGKSSAAPWDLIAGFMITIARDSADLLPFTMDAENVTKVVPVHPWLSRVEDLKAAAAVNVDAERNIVKLTEEARELTREIRKRDIASQESAVKIELMERRMEAAKKQVDVISGLENDLSKSKKQEKANEDMMEQLQAEMDELEQENSKLKQLAATADKGATGPSLNTAMDTTTFDGSLETHYLLNQIESLRGAVRHLNQENSFLKSRDLVKDLMSLPPLAEISSPYDALPPDLSPPGSPASVASSLPEEDNPMPSTPPSLPSLHTLNNETKLLYRRVAMFTSSPKVVDLSGAGPNAGWQRAIKQPDAQMEERRREMEKLERMVGDLKERVVRVTRASFGIKRY